MSFFEGRLKFEVLYFALSAKKDLKAIAKGYWEYGGTVNPSSMSKAEGGDTGSEIFENIWPFYTGGQLNGIKKHKPSKLIYFHVFWMQV